MGKRERSISSAGAMDCRRRSAVTRHISLGPARLFRQPSDRPGWIGKRSWRRSLSTLSTSARPIVPTRWSGIFRSSFARSEVWITCGNLASAKEMALAEQEIWPRVLEDKRGSDQNTSAATCSGRAKSWSLSSSRIEAAFSKLKREGKPGFIPFITAGDPDLDTTAELLLELANSGRLSSNSEFPSATQWQMAR